MLITGKIICDFKLNFFVFHYYRKFLWGDILGASPTQVFKDNS